MKKVRNIQMILTLRIDFESHILGLFGSSECQTNKQNSITDFGA